MAQQKKQSKIQSKQQTGSSDHQTFVLLELLHFYERIRVASLQELRYISVNEIYNLIPYNQAVLWEIQGKTAVITALSGVAEADNNGAYVNFLKKLYRDQLRDLEGTETKSLSDTDDKALKDAWREHLPEQIIFRAMSDKTMSDKTGPDQNGQKIGGIMLARKSPWPANESVLLAKIVNSLSVEFAAKQQKERSIFVFIRKLKASKLRFVLLALCLGILLFPFRTSVLAPAEIIAANPELIRAPIDGVIENIHVRPNDQIQKNQLLVTFDQAALKAQKDVSHNGLKIAEAELRQVSQEAMNNVKAAGRLSFLKGKVEQEKTNLAYYEDLLMRKN